VNTRRRGTQVGRLPVRLLLQDSAVAEAQGRPGESAVSRARSAGAARRRAHGAAGPFAVAGGRRPVARAANVAAVGGQGIQPDGPAQLPGEPVVRRPYRDGASRLLRLVLGQPTQLGREAAAPIFWCYSKRAIRITAVVQTVGDGAMGGQVALLRGFPARRVVKAGVSVRGGGSGP